MRHLFKLSILFFFTFFLLGCFCKIPYSTFQNVFNKPLPNVIHTIHTELKIDGKENKMACTSFHIGKGYLVTCTHGIKKTKQYIKTLFGIAIIFVKGTDYKYYLEDKTELKLIGTIEDIALLYSETLKNTEYIEFHNSDLLKIGDRLILIGNTNMEGKNVKQGIVSKLNINKPILNFTNKETARESMIVSTPVNPGDSGSPIFAIENKTNKFYCVGMVCGKMTKADGYGIVIKSNYITKILRKINEN